MSVFQITPPASGTMQGDILDGKELCSAPICYNCPVSIYMEEVKRGLLASGACFTLNIQDRRKGGGRAG